MHNFTRNRAGRQRTNIQKQKTASTGEESGSLYNRINSSQLTITP